MEYTPEEIEKLQAEVDEDYPETFRFDENNDHFVGIFLEKSTGPSQFSPTGEVPIYILQDPQDGAKRTVWGLHTVLVDEMGKARPQVGDLVAIKYLGEVQGGRGTVKKYRVKVNRKHTGVDWSDHGHVSVVAEDAEDGTPVILTPTPTPSSIRESIEIQDVSAQARATIRTAVQQGLTNVGAVMDAAMAAGSDAHSVSEFLATASEEQLTNVAKVVAPGVV